MHSNHSNYYTLGLYLTRRILLSGVLRFPDILEPVASTHSSKLHSISSAQVRYELICIVSSRREKNTNVCTGESSRKCLLFPAGLVFFVHAEPSVWEAEFLQRLGHLGAVGRRGGKHYRHAVLVQCQHCCGALAQVQQQSHAGEVKKQGQNAMSISRK